MNDFEKRAATLFQRAEETLQVEFRMMFNDMSARGVLASSMTMQRALTIYEERMSAALTQLQKEVATQIEYRGRKWKAAMASIHNALNQIEHTAPITFERVSKLTRNQNVALGAYGPTLNAIFRRLHEQADEFAEGWTAPPAKSWHERHPLVYGALSATGGAILGWIGGAITG